MTGTSVDAALTALVDVFTAANVLNVTVIDTGPPIDPGLNWLCVGFSRPDQPGVTVSSSEADAGAVSSLEEYDISNTLAFWLGDSTAALTRAPLLSAFEAYRNALRLNRTLGGVVMRAYIDAFDLVQDPSTLGNAAAIHFNVHVEAFA